MRGDLCPQAPRGVTDRAFAGNQGRGMIRLSEGPRGGPEAPSDFGLHFFLYLRRVFLYYFR